MKLSQNYGGIPIFPDAREQDVYAELIDKGLIFEINRRVLQPFGFAVGTAQYRKCDNDKIVHARLAIVDLRGNDPISFDDDAFSRGRAKFRGFINGIGRRMLVARKRSLGFFIQGEDKDRAKGADDMTGIFVAAQRNALDKLLEQASNALRKHGEEELAQKIDDEREEINALRH